MVREKANWASVVKLFLWGRKWCDVGQRGTGEGREKAGAQCQLEGEYIKRVAGVADDYAEWVHAGLIKKATLLAFVEFGSAFNSCLL